MRKSTNARQRQESKEINPRHRAVKTNEREKKLRYVYSCIWINRKERL